MLRDHTENKPSIPTVRTINSIMLARFMNERRRPATSDALTDFIQGFQRKDGGQHQQTARKRRIVIQHHDLLESNGPARSDQMKVGPRRAQAQPQVGADYIVLSKLDPKLLKLKQ